MKKNFLFKGVSVLGAILLLANVALPGMVAYAQEAGTSVETVPATVVITTENNSEFETNGEIYDFTSFSSDDSHTEYATGKAQVVAQGTVVEVEENYKVEGANDEGTFVGKQFAIKATEDSLAKNKAYQLYAIGENAMSLTNSVYVKIGEKNTENDSTYYDFVSYAEEGATTKWGDGKVKVITGFTTVTVTENYAKESSWVGKQFTIDESVRDDDKTKLHKITPSDNSSSDSNLYVQIVNKKEGEGENAKITYDYVSYNCTPSGESTEPSAESCTKWGYGTVEVVTDTQNQGTTSTDTTTPTTTVKVIENYAKTNAFVDDKYTVNETLRDGDVEAYHKLLPAVSLENNNSSNTANLSDELYVQIVKENEIEGENGKTTYDYISYIKNGETYTKRGYGTVELEEQGTIVEVVENYRLDSSFVGQNFYIYALEAGDTSVYQLHTATSTSETTPIYVKVSKNGEKYDFVSYAEEGATTKWGDGTVKVLNPFTVVKVTENSVENFVNKHYVIYATEISSNSDYIPLYDTQGTAANISIKLSAFTVSFNSNGGSDVVSQTVNPGEKATKPAEPTKSNYTFKGWFSDEALTTEWNFDSNTVTKNTTLYAKWEQKSSSSSSSSGGGGGSSKKSTTTTTTGTNNTKVDTTKNDNTNNEGDNLNEGNNQNVNTNNYPVITQEDIEKYGQEQIDAYKWAYENGITTMNNVKDARLDQPLTRAELAKMMVVYVSKVLEKQPVLTGEVSYPDVKVEELGDLAGYIKLAYQYQIMGINADGTPIEEFNPNGIVSRGEYATVFSRVLFGALFNKEGEDFYTDHIEALNKAGILSNKEPTIQEMRGWVMLMMYRSSQNAEKIAEVAAELGATE